MLERILETPHLARAIPRLQPELLHQVIERCGLEDCVELVMLTTPQQLTRILDLDLWHATPGHDEQFDVNRFGVWLEVLMEAGPRRAADKVAEIDADLVVAGLAGHVRVFDRAAVTPYVTLDGDVITPAANPGDVLTSEIGGYLLAAKRTDAWEALTSVLTSLEAEHPSFFDEVMSGCRALSYSRPEVDGLDNVLDVDEQATFDLAADRERRRDTQGYTTPAQARAFLQMSRELRLDSATMPPPNPIARAYFQAIEVPAPRDESESPDAASPESHTDSGAKASADAVAAVVDILTDAGIMPPRPRALLNAAADDRSPFERLHRHMQVAIDGDVNVWSVRNQELAYLTNVIMAGCSIQSRPWTLQEASDAAIAVCSLGLENWPSHWLPPHDGPSEPDGTIELPEAFLMTHDLVTVFQVGWKVLYTEVTMYVSGHLVRILDELRVAASEIQTDLDTLYAQLSRSHREGAPWRARDALEVIAILDMPAWAALLGLIDELPVIHAAMTASLNSHARWASPTAFEYISESRQVAAVREFVRLLPDALGAR